MTDHKSNRNIGNTREKGLCSNQGFKRSYESDTRGQYISEHIRIKSFKLEKDSTDDFVSVHDPRTTSSAYFTSTNENLESAYRQPEPPNNFLELLQLSKGNSGGRQGSPPQQLLQSDADNDYLIEKVEGVLLSKNKKEIYKKVDGETFLHSLLKRQFSKITPPQFHQLVVTLEDGKCTNIFNITDDYKGRTPLHLAIRNLKLQENTLNLLHAKRVNFKVLCKNDDSLLMYALSGCGGSLRLVRSLVKKFKVDWKQRNKMGASVLHIASANDQVSSRTLEFLLDLGELSINQSNNNGDTPLLYCANACAKNLNHGMIPSMRKLEFLVKAGSDVNIKNQKGRSAMDMLNNVELNENENEDVCWYWIVLKRILKGSKLGR